MLIGSPGTGKTTMAECLIESVDRRAFICRKKSFDGKFVKQIVNVFDEAKNNAPSIVLLDDLDEYVAVGTAAHARDFSRELAALREITFFG